MGVGAIVKGTGPDRLSIIGLPADRIVGLLAENAVPVSEVAAHRPSLEQAYLAMTREAVEFATALSGSAQGQELREER
jgi:ABC-2 type transport system ATP-binding protein